jgi:hypothetical protein
MEAEWSSSHAGRFTPQGKNLWYPLDRRLDGPRKCVDAVVKRKTPSL